MKSDSRKPEQWSRKIQRFVIQNKSYVAGGLLISLGILAATLQHSLRPKSAAAIAAPLSLSELQGLPESVRWGFSQDEYMLEDKQLQSGDVLGKILCDRGMTYQQVQQLVDQCKDKFNINSLRIGQTLHFLKKGIGPSPQYMVYEPSPYQYTIFHLEAPYAVETTKRDVKTEIVAASGVLESSFWQALTDNGLSDELADGMIDILASSVDFYHQKVGDRFKVVFEQNSIDGKVVGTGKIIAAMYEREGKQFYAFNYEKDGQKCNYFDFDGRPARKAFLKSPVKFSRISSRYNLHRMHPILGYEKAHLGTDYAAPYGTPIMSVADGTVLEATRKGGNGNYVKIRHDAIYTTQYLHMSGFAKGIRPGTHVAQGQTIGYVGATGLATGPHCCFRFWKNGVEVDHLRLNLPQPEPIKGAILEEFKGKRDDLLKLLDQVQYRTHDQIYQEGQGFEKIKAAP